MIDLQMEFDKYEDDFGEFGLVKNKLNARSDLCAFLLLDKLVPENQNMVSATGHDVIYMYTDCNKLAEVATSEDILTLVRCGVMYSVEYDCLEMGV